MGHFVAPLDRPAGQSSSVTDKRDEQWEKCEKLSLRST